MCMSCRKKERLKDIPTKEVLEGLIYNNSFVAIGKMFGKSDNAVRKWCKKHGLPYRQKDLHKNI